MDLGLKDRTAFVSGASAGLGFAVAKSLLEEGCHVAICSRSEERIGAAARKLEHLGEVIPLVCDVTEEAQVKAALDAAGSHFGGRLNVLVTNAGGPPAGLIDDFSADDWRRGVELNLMSTINLSRHALPYLRAAMAEADPLGRIVMITSLVAKEPSPDLYLSNAARAGVQGFCKTLSYELGPEAITVNTVLPGYTETERLIDLAESAQRRTGQSIEETYEEWSRLTAVKRLAQPDELAAAVTFLAGRQAGYITGIALCVDGGRLRGLF